MSTTKTPLSQIIPLSDLPWQERQPGVKRKSLWEDAESKRRAAMTRIAPGAQLPLHRHVGDELIFVIEGAISDEFGTITAGNMGYRPERLCPYHIDAERRDGPGDHHRRRGAGRAAEQRAPVGGLRGHDLPWIEARPGVRQKRIWEDKAGTPSGGRSWPTSSRAPAAPASPRG